MPQFQRLAAAVLGADLAKEADDATGTGVRGREGAHFPGGIEGGSQ